MVNLFKKIKGYGTSQGVDLLNVESTIDKFRHCLCTVLRSISLDT